MKYFLVGGAPNVGKSESIHRCTLALMSRGFKVVKGTVHPHQKDFRAILEGLNQNGKTIKILINTASDTPAIIEKFKRFMGKNDPCDICISPVRDDDFWPRKEFFRILDIDIKKSFILEIPLAKITRRGSNKTRALHWYRHQVDDLIKYCLKSNPFNL